MTSAARTAFSLAYEGSPIILTGGVATAVGGALPIIALTGGLAALVPSSLNPLTAINNPNQLFATYYVMPGGTLVNNTVAMYPFANQTVAANAIIAQPLGLSVKMLVPVNTPATLPGLPSLPIIGQATAPLTGGYSTKLATMSALQATLATHNNQGGTYSIVTPSFLYTYCIMTGWHDISPRGPTQTQVEWQFDFVKPLVSVQAAQTSLNGLMSKLSDGTAISGTPSWTPPGLSLGNTSNLVTQGLTPQPALSPALLSGTQ